MIRFVRFPNSRVAHVARWSGFGRYHVACYTLGWPPFIEQEWDSAVERTIATTEQGRLVVIKHSPDFPVCKRCCNRIDSEHDEITEARQMAPLP